MKATLIQDFERWLETSGSKRRSPRTLAVYRRYADEFVRTVGHPQRVTEKQLREWQDTMRRCSTTGDSTQNVRVAAVRSLFRFAEDTGIRPTNPAAAVVRMRRLPKRMPQFVDRAVLKQLFDHLYTLDGPAALQDRALLECLYGSGLRREEAARLTLANFISDSVMSIIGKGDKQRMTIVTGAQFRAVQAWAVVRFGDAQTTTALGQFGEAGAFHDIRRRFADAPLFVTTDEKPVMDLADPGRWVWQRVRSCAEAAGIGHLRAHQLRHSFATHLLGSGSVNLREAQEMLGHSDIETTSVYVGIEGESFTRIRAAHPRS
jgi:integrase/recombinase XerD